MAGANSAGQAALHLAKFAARVTLLVWGELLAASMSDYLITQLKATPQNIEVRLRTRVADGHGQVRLEALTLEDVRTGQREQVPAAAVFGMIGTEPRTQWVRDLVKLNDRGFILTGRTFPGRMTAAPSTPAVRDEPAGRISRPAACGTAPSSASPGRSARGVQVRSRFRDLRGSAAGLSHG